MTQNTNRHPRYIGSLLVLGLFALLLTVSGHGATTVQASNHIIYVDADATGNNDGSTWNDAYTTVQDALNAAGSGDELWVAEGIYYPDEGAGQTNDYRFATFQLRDGVALYGGFAGGETVRDQRDPASNVAVLSGDIDGNDTTDATGVVTDTTNIVGENSCHVVTGSGTDSSAVLDGVTITAGQANSNVFTYDSGGGMYNDAGSPTLTSVSFSGNSADTKGGGIYNVSSSSPTLTNVSFSGNGLAGMYNEDSNPTLVNVSFSGTSSSGMENYNSSPTLTNVSFNGNSFAGMYNEDSSPTLTNVSFSGNSYGGMNNNSSSPTIHNSIFWNNQHPFATGASEQIYNSNDSSPTISHSLVQDSGGSAGWDTNLGNDGGGNIDADPRFVDAAGGDLRLQNFSLAIDVGDNDAVPAGVTTDLAGNPRILDGDDDGTATVDMGAYETQPRNDTLPRKIYLPVIIGSGQ